MKVAVRRQDEHIVACHFHAIDAKAPAIAQQYPDAEITRRSADLLFQRLIAIFHVDCDIFAEEAGKEATAECTGSQLEIGLIVSDKLFGLLIKISEYPVRNRLMFCANVTRREPTRRYCCIFHHSNSRLRFVLRLTVSATSSLR
ncbi:hypothetical protein [Hoeflea sp. TYP-13]|uniref:hypothetical protein n=1 Tax=Hoeflea sp. TYP-13 TaxID=3230023 RepID=UPI0034C6D8F4